MLIQTSARGTPPPQSGGFGRWYRRAFPLPKMHLEQGHHGSGNSRSQRQKLQKPRGSDPPTAKENCCQMRPGKWPRRQRSKVKSCLTIGLATGAIRGPLPRKRNSRSHLNPFGILQNQESSFKLLLKCERRPLLRVVTVIVGCTRRTAEATRRLTEPSILVLIRSTVTI